MYSRGSLFISMKEQNEQEARLVRENIGLVISQALKFKPTRVTDVDDYIQAGSIGLLKAIRKYQPERGKLSSFAWPSIWREIVHEANKFKEATQSLEFDISVDYVDNLKDCIPDLTPDQLQIFTLRAEGHTLKEIGSRFDKTKEWARQQLNVIIQKIRDLHDEQEEDFIL
jgi:DNA-directed RNA polymerase sigma subunit (sigma70/sigma32)